jgi:thiamine-phosphate pyrophosphorylase
VNLPRLYAILDVTLAEQRGLIPERLVDTWLDAGVRLIQLRAKTMAAGAMLELADRLSAAIRSAGGLFVVNDRVDVARMSGASGVHVGQDDLSPADARLAMPEGAMIGVSTHTEPQLRAALDSPADYVAIGPVFPTQSKTQPDPVVGLDGVRLAASLAQAAGRPLVAIGGITLERAAGVIAAGADSVAVISDLITGEPAARARAFVDAVK